VGAMHGAPASIFDRIRGDHGAALFLLGGFAASGADGTPDRTVGPMGLAGWGPATPGDRGGQGRHVLAG
jgi:hypothetical protein